MFVFDDLLDSVCTAIFLKVFDPQSAEGLGIFLKNAKMILLKGETAEITTHKNSCCNNHYLLFYLLQIILV